MGKPHVLGRSREGGSRRHTAQGAPAGRVVILTLFSVSAVLLWAASEWSTTTVQQVTLSSLSLTAVAWGGAILIAGRTLSHQSYLRLGPWMLAYGGITFGLASLTAWLAPETLSSQLQLDSFRAAHVLAIVGFIAFIMGYLFTPRAGLHQLLDSGLARVARWDEGKGAPLLSTLLVYLLGLGALILAAILSGSYSYLGDSKIMSAGDTFWYTQPLHILSLLQGFAIVALWVTILRRPTPMRALLAVAVTAVDLTAGILSGMKEAPILTLIAAGLAFIHVKRRLPLLGFVAFGAWFTFFLSPLVASLRAIVRGGGVLTLQEALPAVRSGLSQTSGGSEGDFWNTLSRLRLIDNLAIINQKTPSELPFQSTWDLVSLIFSSFIPRAIWPTKPVRIEGLLFYQDYYGGTSYSSSALTVPGSLYLYGGLIVLVIGMVLFGMLTRTLDDGMRAHESQTGLMLLLALFPYFLKMEVSAPTLLAALPGVGLGWLLASSLLFRNSRNRIPDTGRRRLHNHSKRSTRELR